MSTPSNPGDLQVWDMLFNQTPVAIRWLLGVLTLGVFTVLSILYRWHRSDVEMLHRRVQSLEQRIDSRFEEMNRHLIDIVTNTGRRRDNE